MKEDYGLGVSVWTSVTQIYANCKSRDDAKIVSNFLAKEIRVSQREMNEFVVSCIRFVSKLYGKIVIHLS